MHQTIDALFFDPDEDTEVRDVAHHTADAGSRRILLFEQGPRVGLHLLHAERDLAFALVDVEHQARRPVADRDHLRGMLDALGPAHLGDVDQPLDARLELDEGSVVGQRDDLAAGRADRSGSAVLDVDPRVRQRLLEARGSRARFRGRT